jgi:hypothetical protein
MRRIPIVAVVLTACQADPSLAVEVRLHESFRDQVVATQLTIYQSETLDCDSIRFGETSDSDLLGAVVDEVELGDSAVLDDLSRLDEKLFVAYGKAADGTRLVAGCGSKGVVVDTDSLVIDTVPVAQVAVASGSIDRPFAQRQIRVYAADAAGAPLDQRALRWESVGPAGSFAPLGVAESEGLLCTRDGAAIVQPADPEVQGPVAARIFVDWADTGPVVVNGFVGNPPINVGLSQPGSPLDLTSEAQCVPRRRQFPGEVRSTVVCLGEPDASRDRKIIEISVELPVDPEGPQASLRELGTVTAPVGLVVAPSTGVTDALYVVHASGFFDGVDGTPDGVTADFCSDRGGTCHYAPTRLTIVPTCSDGPPLVWVELAVTGTTSTAIGSYLPNGSGFPGIEEQDSEIHLTAAGCVADITGEVRPTVAISTSQGSGSAGNAIIFPCGFATPGDAPCSVSWFGHPGVGYSSGDEPRLIGSQISLSGTNLMEWVLARTNSTDREQAYRLIDRRATATISPPRSIAAGHFDADASLDLVWSENLGDGLRLANRLQFAVDIEIDDERLTGLAPSPELTGPSWLVTTTDLDADGRDDVIGYSTQRAFVYLTGPAVAAAPITDNQTYCP